MDPTADPSFSPIRDLSDVSDISDVPDPANECKICYELFTERNSKYCHSCGGLMCMDCYDTIQEDSEHCPFCHGNIYDMTVIEPPQPRVARAVASSSSLTITRETTTTREVIDLSERTFAPGYGPVAPARKRKRPVERPRFGTLTDSFERMERRSNRIRTETFVVYVNPEHKDLVHELLNAIGYFLSGAERFHYSEGDRNITRA